MEAFSFLDQFVWYGMVNDTLNTVLVAHTLIISHLGGIYYVISDPLTQQCVGRNLLCSNAPFSNVLWPGFNAHRHCRARLNARL